MAEIHNNYSGATIVFQSGSTQNGDVKLEACTIVNNGSKEDGHMVEESNPYEAYYAQLLPMFNNKQEVMEQFLKSIESKNPVEVAVIVNGYVKRGEIDAKYKYKPLHNLLKQMGLYNPGLSNWYAQIE